MTLKPDLAQYAFGQVCHNHKNSLLIRLLVTFVAPTPERLYRVRHLHRGTHPVLERIASLRLLWLSPVEAANSS